MMIVLSYCMGEDRIFGTIGENCDITIEREGSDYIICLLCIDSLVNKRMRLTFIT